MAELFDSGRPTGALGGEKYAEDTRRKRRVEDFELKTKQAEFHDWLDAEEYRKESRKTGVAQAKAVREVLPHQTKAEIETAKTTEAQKQADRELIQPMKTLELDKIHASMDQNRYNKVTRAYSVFSEGIKAGHDPKELYKMAYQELINTADPAQAARWLGSHGIIPEPDEQAINKMAALAAYGMHDAPTTRAEHLLDREWSLRIQKAKAEARAKGPEDTRYKFPDQTEMKAIGGLLSSYIKGFDKLQGTVDDSGNFTGSKKSVVDTITSLSLVAQRDQILGDPNVTPVHYQLIAADVLNFAGEDMTEDGWWFFGYNNTGDTFRAAPFVNTVETALGVLEVERARHIASTGSDIDIRELWKAKSPQILSAIRESNKKMKEQGFMPDSGVVSPDVPVPQGSGGINAGSVEQNINPPPKTSSQKMSRRQEINKQIASMSTSEKFSFTSKGKVKTPAYQALLDERRSLGDSDLGLGGA